MLLLLGFRAGEKPVADAAEGAADEGDHQSDAEADRVDRGAAGESCHHDDHDEQADGGNGALRRGVLHEVPVRLLEADRDAGVDERGDDRADRECLRICQGGHGACGETESDGSDGEAQERAEKSINEAHWSYLSVG